MPKERIRETLEDGVDLDALERKQQEGWRAVAIEWERESHGRPELVREREEIPYGARVSTRRTAPRRVTGRDAGPHGHDGSHGARPLVLADLPTAECSGLPDKGRQGVDPGVRLPDVAARGRVGTTGVSQQRVDEPQATNGRGVIRSR